MSYSLPSDVDARPVTVVGAGTLGRRIAAMFAAGGTDVRVFDLSAEQRAAAVAYATEQAPGIGKKLGLTAPRSGAVEAAADLPGAVNRAWLVIEAVPEKRDLKIENYFNGYLKHPYLSLHTGRGCKSPWTGSPPTTRSWPATPPRTRPAS